MPPGPIPHIVSQEFGWSVELGQKNQVERKPRGSLVTPPDPAPLEFTADSLEGNFWRVTGQALTGALRTHPPSPFPWTLEVPPPSSLASAGLSKLLCKAARPCLGSPMM